MPGWLSLFFHCFARLKFVLMIGLLPAEYLERFGSRAGMADHMRGQSGSACRLETCRPIPPASVRSGKGIGGVQALLHRAAWKALVCLLAPRTNPDQYPDVEYLAMKQCSGLGGHSATGAAAHGHRPLRAGNLRFASSTA